MATSAGSSPKRLRLTGVPADRNNIQTLSDYFKQFGTISSIIIEYHGNSDAALVTFSSHEEADAAFNSHDPVLGNQNIKVQWDIRTTKPSSKTEASSSSKNSTFQCPKCTKILASRRTLQNHMRQLHTQFNCPACRHIFDSANEFRKHYNAAHSDSKDFSHHTDESKEQNNVNFVRLNETVAVLHHKNASLKKKVKKHKKDKSKAVDHLKTQLVKLLEGQQKKKLFSFDFFLTLNFC